jgi:hypothetical protein
MDQHALRITLLITLLAVPVAGETGFHVTTPGKPGSGGLVPALDGSGPLTPGSPGNAVTVTDGLSLAPATLVVGFSELGVPFKGGILAPQPDLLLDGLALDAAGALSVPFSLPPTVSVGWSVWVQAWIQDPGAGAGLSASNGLRVTVAPDLAGPLLPGPVYLVGDRPVEVTATDLDGDLVPDLVTYNSNSRDGSLLLGNGDGTFAPAQTLDLGTFPTDLLLADLDQDGVPDLAISSQNPDEFRVRSGLGDGTFAPAVGHALPGDPREMDAGDVTGDGVPDLVACMAASTVVTLPGTGGGAFGAPLQSGGFTFPADFELADLDGDGLLDAVDLTLFQSLFVGLGAGDGSFTALPATALPGAATSLATGDMNGDGDLDVAMTDLTADGVRLLIGKGDGTFKPLSFLVPTGLNPQGVAVADLDADGLLDLAVAVAGEDFPLEEEGSLALLLSNGTGSFSGPAAFHAGGFPSAVAVADLDCDGRLDMVVTDLLDAVAVFLGADGPELVAHATAVPMGHHAGRPTAADLDADGWPDLVNAWSDGGATGFSVSMALGGGAFADPVDVATSAPLAELDTADMNGDGNLDLLVLLSDLTGASEVFAGDGLGGFGSLGLGPELRLPSSAAVGDLTGDGILDVIATHGFSVPFPESVAVMHGAAGGALVAGASMYGGNAPRTVELADLDLDGDLDAVVGNTTSASISVVTLRGLGDGTFLNALGFPGGQSVLGLAVADVTGDGLPDVASADLGGEQVVLLRGNGNGTLSPLSSHPLGFPGSSVAIGDLDGDGEPDVVTSTSGRVGVLLHDGLGIAADPTWYHGGAQASGVVLADLDGDGALDVATGGGVQQAVKVLTNQSP